jgi:hypothetical protein
MGFYSSYKPVFDDVKTKLEAIDSIQRVVMAERFSVTDLPMCVVNMDETPIDRLTISKVSPKLALNIGFSVIIFVMETEPTDWMTDIISIMGDVFDALVADNRLSGAVLDVWPTFFAPGEAVVKDRLYYGGIIRFQALVHFTPG